MIFGIDFDQTFSADPELFHGFLDLLEKRGHKAVIVTNRKKPSFGEPSVMNGVEITIITKGRIPVVYANGSKTKREAATEEGYKIDIWIDDNPFYIDREKAHK